MGVSTDGVTANFVFFDRGTFWVPICQNLSKSDKFAAYLFPQSVRMHYFCSDHISVDPTCPQRKVEPENLTVLNCFLTLKDRGKISHQKSQKSEVPSAPEKPLANSSKSPLLKLIAGVQYFAPKGRVQGEARRGDQEPPPGAHPWRSDLHPLRLPIHQSVGPL